MRTQPVISICGVVASAVLALMLVGCNGKAGQNGINGTNGTNGTNGQPGPAYALDATTLSTTEWEELTLKANVTRAAVVAGQPVVDFTVADQHNTPLKGLGYTGKSATDLYPIYANMGFSIAKLVPGANGSPSRWVSYIVTSNPTIAAPTTWVPTRPTTDTNGTLVDHGDGSYTYTFRRDISQLQAQVDAYTGYNTTNVKADLDNVTYDSALTHRLTVYVGGAARDTGSNTADRSNTGLPSVPVKFPANLAYDFIPATGLAIGGSAERRDMVDTTSCFSCHAKFEFHGEGRQDARYCMVCHNDQRKYGRTEAATTATGYSGSTNKIEGRAAGDMPAFIHRLHMGEELTKTGYNYGGVLFNEVTYPQDHRNCVKCHTATTATPQGDNWFNKPNRMACGACHDKVSFATGVNHGPNALIQTSDVACAGCHTAADIKTNHIPVTPPNPLNIWNAGGTENNTNAAYVAAFTNNLPVGADVVTYDLSSVTLNASAKPVFKFRFLKNGTPVVFNTYAAGTVTEMMDNFAGGPSFYIAFSVPQDGIAAPADWNATASTYLKNIWRGDGLTMTGTALAVSAQGTLTGPDGTGYYTLTMTGVVIPTTAQMITGGIGYTYGLTATQPLTQTNVPGYPYTNPNAATLPKNQGGLSVPAPNVYKLVSGTMPAGFTAQAARRTIVANAKCNDCHGALGVFTSKSYHAGQRNDATSCEFCHNGQRVNSGWGVNAKDFVHAIHGAGKRVNKYSWEASAGFKYWTVTYPSILNNCEACHVPGSYDFERAANAAAYPNLLWTTVATGTTPNPVVAVVTGNETIPGTYWSPFAITAAAALSGTNNPNAFAFGSGFSFNANTGATTAAAGTTLVSSPYVAACSNCHDSSLAIDHMKTNGGSFYATRASVQTAGVFTKQEQCFLCHSAGKIADTEKVHMNFK